MDRFFSQAITIFILLILFTGSISHADYTILRAGTINIENAEKVSPDPQDPKNALYTQIVNYPFSVNILSLFNDGITPAAPLQEVMLTLTIVEVNEDGSCSQLMLSDPQTVTFTTQDKYKSITITPLRASKNSTFRIVTDSIELCSGDNFAIRPKEYISTFTPIDLIKAGVDFNLNLVAKGFDLFPINGYNGVVKIDALTQNPSCPVPNGDLSDASSNSSLFQIFDGVDTASFNSIKFDDIGSFDIIFTDSSWSAVDSIKGDCILNSSQNEADIDQKIGCNISSTSHISVIPHHFEVVSKLKDQSNAFTYLSLDLNNSATLDINITAKSFNQNTTKNYTSGCYAKSTDYNISYSPLSITPKESLTKLNFIETQSLKSQNIDLNSSILLTNISSSIFKRDGTGSISLAINFDRDSTKVVNPFLFKISDIKVIDQDLVNGVDIPDTNTTFIYGRTHASRQRYNDKMGSANIYFESYCYGDGCNKDLLPNGVNSRRVDDIRWFINENHLAPKDGIIDLESSNMVSATPANYAIFYKPTTILTYNQTMGYPYKTAIFYSPSNWLIHNEREPNAKKDEFIVEFVDPEILYNKPQNTTTSNTSPSVWTNRRLDW